jgi:hypothetical protein
MKHPSRSNLLVLKKSDKVHTVGVRPLKLVLSFVVLNSYATIGKLLLCVSSFVKWG